MHSVRVADRTRVIFGPPGHAHVYFIYGMYECLNLVAKTDGQPGCVPGPGRLTLALGITRAQNGVDVTRGPHTVRTPRRDEAFEIEVTPRIGIRHCADWPLRYAIRGNPFVSG